MQLAGLNECDRCGIGDCTWCDWNAEQEETPAELQLAGVGSDPYKEEEQIMTTTITNREPEPWEIADAYVQTVNCQIEGCDGAMHDASEDPAEWGHRVFSATFEFISYEIVLRPSEQPPAHVYFDGDSDGFDQSTAEIRAGADRWAKHPAFLRELADLVDAINASYGRER